MRDVRNDRCREPNRKPWPEPVYILLLEASAVIFWPVSYPRLKLRCKDSKA